MKVQRHTISTVKSTLQVQFSTILGHLIEINLFLDLDHFRDRRSLISPARLTLIGEFPGHELNRFLKTGRSSSCTDILQKLNRYSQKIIDELSRNLPSWCPGNSNFGKISGWVFQDLSIGVKIQTEMTWEMIFSRAINNFLILPIWKMVLTVSGNSSEGLKVNLNDR